MSFVAKLLGLSMVEAVAVKHNKFKKITKLVSESLTGFANWAAMATG